MALFCNERRAADLETVHNGILDDARDSVAIVVEAYRRIRGRRAYAEMTTEVSQGASKLVGAQRRPIELADVY
jgi:hypothetical protein